ncbi:MAG: hypothetical protein DDG58_08965 [Ardenticatenia bacterium]|nr:MAG: hypothetical protein DDG58_08965 [Ardenticatenia bacterium]
MHRRARREWRRRSLRALRSLREKEHPPFRGITLWAELPHGRAGSILGRTLCAHRGGAVEYYVRPATYADVPAIGRVARETWRTTYAHTIAPHNQQRVLERSYADAALAAALQMAQSWFFVAVNGEEVLGFAQFMCRGDGHGELVRIYVLPAHQRQGIGRALLQAGVRAMAAVGIHRCYVSVEVDNVPAIAFYQHFGFRYHRAYASFVGDQLVHLLELKTSLRALRYALETE